MRGGARGAWKSVGWVKAENSRRFVAKKLVNQLILKFAYCSSWEIFVKLFYHYNLQLLNGLSGNNIYHMSYKMPNEKISPFLSPLSRLRGNLWAHQRVGCKEKGRWHDMFGMQVWRRVFIPCPLNGPADPFQMQNFIELPIDWSVAHCFLISAAI